MTTEARVLDKHIELNGLTFHYRDWQNQGAQTLLLLHGFTGHARSWDTLAAALADRYHVLALDQRGHGETSWAPDGDYTPERMVQDIDAFVQALGLRQFALLGLSMGGRNAYHYTGLHPQEVERLVIVDIGPEIVASGSDRIRQGTQAADAFDSPEQAIAQSRAANPRADQAELRARVTNNLMQTGEGRWTWRYDTALRNPATPLPRPDPAAAWALLPRITCPTLLVRGELSDILAVETAERMTREIPNCRMVTVPGAGHSIPLDSPRGMIESVQGFL